MRGGEIGKLWWVCVRRDGAAVDVDGAEVGGEDRPGPEAALHGNWCLGKCLGSRLLMLMSPP